MVCLSTSIQPGQSACPCSVTRLYTAGSSIFFSDTEIPIKLKIMFQIQSRDNPFTKF
jgi:hypothetical protein